MQNAPRGPAYIVLLLACLVYVSAPPIATAQATWTLDPVLPGGGTLTGGATIEKFEVVVEMEDPLGVAPTLVFRVELPASATSFTVPAEALQAGMDAKVEVLAIGENGNKIAGEVDLGTINP